MENKTNNNIGEEIISRLTETNRILERILQEGSDAKELSPTCND